MYLQRRCKQIIVRHNPQIHTTKTKKKNRSKTTWMKTLLMHLISRWTLMMQVRKRLKTIPCRDTPLKIMAIHPEWLLSKQVIIRLHKRLKIIRFKQTVRLISLSISKHSTIQEIQHLNSSNIRWRTGYQQSTSLLNLQTRTLTELIYPMEEIQINWWQWKNNKSSQPKAANLSLLKN